MEKKGQSKNSNNKKEHSDCYDCSFREKYQSEKKKSIKCAFLFVALFCQIIDQTNPFHFDIQENLLQPPKLKKKKKVSCIVLKLC